MNLKVILLTLFASFFIVSCSKILVRPELEITQREERNIKKEYEVVEKFLTAEEISYQNQSQFSSKVKIYNSKSNSQEIITLEDFSREILPNERVVEDYVLGSGDVVSVSRSAHDLVPDVSFNGDSFFSENLEIDSAGYVKTIDGLRIKLSGSTVREVEILMEPALRSKEYLYQDQIVEKPFPPLAQEKYRLGAGDLIQLTRLLVSVDPENGRRIQQTISYELVMEQDGSIQFIELDGRLMLSGQTLQEAQDTIRQELLRSGLSTAVTVALKKYASQTIYITGEFGPSMVVLRPGFRRASRVILSYLTGQADNVVRLGGNYDEYLVKLTRGKEFFQVRLSTLLSHSDKDKFTLLNGDRLAVIKIMKSPKIKLKVEKFASSYVTLTQDTPFEMMNMEKLQYEVAGVGKTLRIFMNDKSLSMYDIVSDFGYWPDEGTDNILYLTRNEKNYRFSANAVIGRGPYNSYSLKNGDIIKLERSKLVRNRVYVFGEVGNVNSILVSKTDRPYLSEVLEKSGAFDIKEADIRHIYVVRQGSLGKFNAFRFDVANVVNFGLVEQLEMRPSDIVLVLTLPLYRFNRFINAVFGVGGNAIGSVGAVVNNLEN